MEQFWVAWVVQMEEGTGWTDLCPPGEVIPSQFPIFLGTLPCRGSLHSKPNLPPYIYACLYSAINFSPPLPTYLFFFSLYTFPLALPCLCPLPCAYAPHPFAHLPGKRGQGAWQAFLYPLLLSLGEGEGERKANVNVSVQ